MKSLMIVLLIMIANICFAADTIIVHKDARLDILTEKQAYLNRVTSKMTSSGMIKGYRLQVLTSRSRDDAFKTKAMLLQNFPEQKTYVLYQSPYFKVRIGNFLTKSDANDFKDLLSNFYTEPAYVIEDIIEYIPGPDDDIFN